MKKAKHKILFGAVFFGCAITAIGGAAFISEKMENQSVPASLISEQEELPIIVLDAGHGGFDGGCVSVEGVPERE